MLLEIHEQSEENENYRWTNGELEERRKTRTRVGKGYFLIF